MFTRISRGFVLRKSQGRLDGFDSLRLSARTMRSSSSSGPSKLMWALGFAVLCLIAVIAVVMAHPEIAQAQHPIASHLSLAGLAIGETAITTGKKSGTDPKKPAKIREMEANLKSLARELEVGQAEMVAGPLSQERGEELEQKAQEMEELQTQIKRYNNIAGIIRRSHEVERVTLPEQEEHINSKRFFTTPGHLFVASPEFKSFQANQSGWSGKVDAGKRLGRRVLLTGKQAHEFELKAFDAANLPTLGADSIIPYDRDPELVRFAEPEILTIRDMLNVVPTTSDAVKYVKYTTTQRAAASQATPGALKGFLKIATELVTTSVETLAVLSKVTEQDIDDAPRLVGLINGEMVLDVKVEEERQLAWGNGLNGNLKGLFDASNALPEFNRAAVGDTIIDTIRKMRTDLRKARVTPNFVAIDPVDWEEVELAKGSTNYYIWGLVSDMRGPRVWSLQVVESDGMTNLETGERRVLMGDGPRGATIYDRSAVQLAVGFMDDDFGRNLRTLRAEERLALAVKRNFAFEFFTTHEADS